jgi:recombination protein RecT
MANEVVTVPKQGEIQRPMTPQDRKLADMRGLIARNIKALTSALPSHMKPERLARITLTTLQKNPKLLDCTQESFLSCILSCAALGLEPDGLLGQAYLIPYKTTCTLVPGYKGLVKLARQSGEIATIDAHEVRVGDAFEYHYGMDPRIHHTPAQAPIVADGKGVLGPDRAWRPGAITHFYAVAAMKDGTIQFCVMPTWEVDEIRDGSQGYQNAVKYNSDNPWMSDYSEMGKKTAIRRLCKLLPSSVEKPQLQQAIAIDERADRGLSQDLDLVADIPALPTQSQATGDADYKPKSLDDVAASAKADRVKVEMPPDPATSIT